LSILHLSHRFTVKLLLCFFLGKAIQVSALEILSLLDPPSLPRPLDTSYIFFCRRPIAEFCGIGISFNISVRWPVCIVTFFGCVFAFLRGLNLLFNNFNIDRGSGSDPRNFD
jgi:hypothetical protein